MNIFIVRTLFFLFLCSGFSTSVTAQGTLDDYHRSITIDTLFQNKMYNSPKTFHWMDNGLLWYMNNSKEGKEYLIVDVQMKSQHLAFDHARLATSLSKLLKKEVSANAISIDSLSYTKNQSQFSFIIDSLVVSCNRDTYVLNIESIKERKKNGPYGYWGERDLETGKDSVLSPDKKYGAYIRNYNVYLIKNDTKQECQLSYDGAMGFYYSSNISWSPDGTKLMAYKIRPGAGHKIYFVESSPQDQLQPRLQSRDYLKPGDEVDFKSPQIFHIADKTQVVVSTELFERQFSLTDFQWSEDSKRLTFEYNQRGHQVYRVLSVNSDTGEVMTVVDEASPTFIDYSGKKFRHDVKSKNEIIWASERDGWNHLYLYDAQTGKVKNQITKGQWPVRDVLNVDDEKRQIYFRASGVDDDMDPYFLHYFRIDFDGRNLVRFTSENGNHEVTFSPDYEYYVDHYSRIDLPQITLLKKGPRAKPIMELQKANISELQGVDWSMPEVFKAKGRDGKTDIWGMIVRPTQFDPQRNYPIIEYIYAGPHSSFVPKSFHTQYRSMSSLAELGFIVVQIDGMGTSNRSKAFHDVCWKNLKDAGFPDRKLWIKAAAKKYPYIDIDRVGIYGTSAGGQSAAGALVFNSDFYKVAVASCGCHDNRMDKIWWNEQWMGYPIGPQYAACSNVENAAQLNGNLLLMVGEVDDNVDPASTFQFADALIKANKDFDLVVLPGMAHTSGGAFGDRKRKDFFVQHLLHVTPPKWNAVYGKEGN